MLLQTACFMKIKKFHNEYSSRSSGFSDHVWDGCGQQDRKTSSMYKTCHLLFPVGGPMACGCLQGQTLIKREVWSRLDNVYLSYNSFLFLIEILKFTTILYDVDMLFKKNSKDSKLSVAKIYKLLWSNLKAVNSKWLLDLGYGSKRLFCKSWDAICGCEISYTLVKHTA